MLPPAFKDKFYRDRANSSRGAGIAGKGCHSTGQGQGDTWVLLETDSGAKEGQASDKPQTTIPVDSIPPFQNGRNIHVVRDLLTKEDYMTRIDLKDAYLVIPIHQQYHHLLRFRWEDQDYKFICLPFGQASTPYVFTKIMRVVVTFLRNRGIRCVIYLDDLLLMNRSPLALAEHTTLMLDLLEALGFLVNYLKSHLTPSQEVEYLGFVVDSTQRSYDYQRQS